METMDTIMEKPPINTKSPLTRRRKVNRQSPVPKRRHSSPVTIRRSKTLDSSSRRNIEESSSDEDLKTINNARKVKKCVFGKRRSRSSIEVEESSADNCNSNFEKEPETVDERKEKYLNKRRHTTNTMPSNTATHCQCRTHKGALKQCHCSRMRQRKTTNISESELMENETKLVVLEFLQKLSAEKLTGRSSRESSMGSHFNPVESHFDSVESHFDSVESRFDSVESHFDSVESHFDSVESHFDPVESNELLYQEEQVAEVAVSSLKETTAQEDMKKEEKKERGSVKYNTVTIGEDQHRQLINLLAQSAANERTGSKLNRSRSDITEEQYAATRHKLKKMEAPILKWMDNNSRVTRKLRCDIVAFDKDKLKTTAKKSLAPKQNLLERKKISPLLSLKIPPHRLPDTIGIVNDTDIFTPETFAVTRLEEISEEIMLNYPRLLEGSIFELLNFTKKEDDVHNYDLFTKVAKPVYDSKIAKVSGTVWSRVALVLYMVRETVFLGNLNDKQLEILVEHSTKFFTENASESVEKEGGWESALADEMFFANGMAFDEYWDSTDDEKCLMHGPGCDSARNEKSPHSSPVVQSLTFRDVTTTIEEWKPYGVAALAVGLGLAYSYMKT